MEKAHARNGSGAHRPYLDGPGISLVASASVATGAGRCLGKSVSKGQNWGEKRAPGVDRTAKRAHWEGVGLFSRSFGAFCGADPCLASRLDGFDISALLWDTTAPVIPNNAALSQEKRSRAGYKSMHVVDQNAKEGCLQRT